MHDRARAESDLKLEVLPCLVGPDSLVAAKMDSFSRVIMRLIGTRAWASPMLPRAWANSLCPGGRRASAPTVNGGCPQSRPRRRRLDVRL